MSIVMYGNMATGLYLPIYESYYTRIGFSFVTATGTGPRTKLLVTLYRGDKASAMELTFIYAPNHLTILVTFIPSRPVRIMGIILGVVDLSTAYMSDPLIVVGKLPA